MEIRVRAEISRREGEGGSGLEGWVREKNNSSQLVSGGAQCQSMLENSHLQQ